MRAAPRPAPGGPSPTLKCYLLAIVLLSAAVVLLLARELLSSCAPFSASSARRRGRVAFVTLMVDDMYDKSYAPDAGLYGESLTVFITALRRHTKHDIIVAMTEGMANRVSVVYRGSPGETRPLHGVPSV